MGASENIQMGTSENIEIGHKKILKLGRQKIQTWISAAANLPPISQAESWLIPSLKNVKIMFTFFSLLFSHYWFTFGLFFSVTGVGSVFSCLLFSNISATLLVRMWGRAWDRRWWGRPPPPRSSSPGRRARPSGSPSTGQLPEGELDREDLK